MQSSSHQMRVEAIRFEAEGVNTIELVSCDDSLLRVEAGAHVDLHLPGNLVRSYSLCNTPGETHRYVVAVAKDASSRGGSAYLHDQLRVGQILKVSEPINNFMLDPSAEHTVLIAGGIGITPIYAMVQALAVTQRRWELHYAARSRRVAAFVSALSKLGHSDRINLHFDEEHAGLPIDLAAVVAGAPEGAHLYCCGPSAMIRGFQEATAALPPRHIHVEFFKAASNESEKTPSGSFQVKLARSGTVLTVDEGRSILDTLLDAGVEVGYSCMEGICGSCEIAVIEGEPDHRDMVLSAAQQKANKSMMICCSRAKSPFLVLDV